MNSPDIIEFSVSGFSRDEIISKAYNKVDEYYGKDYGRITKFVVRERVCWVANVIAEPIESDITA